MVLLLRFLFGSRSREQSSTRRLSMFCWQNFLVTEKETMYRLLVAREHRKCGGVQTNAFVIGSFRHCCREGIDRRYPVKLVSNMSFTVLRIKAYIIGVYWVAKHKFVINCGAKHS